MGAAGGRELDDCSGQSRNRRCCPFPSSRMMLWTASWICVMSFWALMQILWLVMISCNSPLDHAGWSMGVVLQEAVVIYLVKITLIKRSCERCALT
jgi:hypothetical protein